MNKKRRVLAIAIIVLVLILVYFLFLYSKNCKDETCFSDSMKSCSKANYINNAEDASWSYAIKGKKSSECVVEVKLLQAKQGKIELEKIQGLSMDCSLPLGYIGVPQADLSRCHGLLKESLQELMIQKLHSYILANLGKIDDALTKAI